MFDSSIYIKDKRNGYFSKRKYDPIDAIFLRNLAWEIYSAKADDISVNTVIDTHVRAAYDEIGLELPKGGAPHQFLAKLRKNGHLADAGKSPIPKNRGWESAWRLHYCPPHNIVRQISFDPIITFGKNSGSELKFRIVLRDPSLPPLTVSIGKNKPEGRFENRRGLYILGLEKALYIGQTDEFGIRIDSHIKKKIPNWWIFFVPEFEQGTFTIDALNVAESLLISFWNEVAKVSNGGRGRDTKPAISYILQAFSVVKGISAAFIWLMRKSELPEPLDQLITDEWKIPFKKISRKPNWSDSYLGKD